MYIARYGPQYCTVDQFLYRTVYWWPIPVLYTVQSTLGLPSVIFDLLNWFSSHDRWRSEYTLVFNTIGPEPWTVLRSNEPTDPLTSLFREDIFRIFSFNFNLINGVDTLNEINSSKKS